MTVRITEVPAEVYESEPGILAGCDEPYTLPVRVFMSGFLGLFIGMLVYGLIAYMLKAVGGRAPGNLYVVVWIITAYWVYTKSATFHEKSYLRSCRTKKIFKREYLRLRNLGLESDESVEQALEEVRRQNYRHHNLSRHGRGPTLSFNFSNIRKKSHI